MEVVLEGKGIALLDFSSYSDKSATPSERTAIDSIATLNASRNHIRSISRLTVFRNLVVLNLSHNQLASPISDWLSELPRSLRELYLSHNEISDLVADGRNSRQRDRSSSICATFCCGPAAFPDLEVLDLSGNLLSEPFEASEASDMDEEEDGSGVPWATSTSCRLASVNLSDNLNIQAVNTMLRGVTTLRHVYLDGNRIANLEGLLSLAACSALEHVTIRGCEVETQMQDPEFLERNFEVERHEARTSGIGQLFVACFVGQVLPRVKKVNDVETAAANEIVIPLLEIAKESQELVAARSNGEPTTDALQGRGSHNRSNESLNNSNSAGRYKQVSQQHQDPSVLRSGQEQSNSVASVLASRIAKVHEKLFADTSSSSIPAGIGGSRTSSSSATSSSSSSSTAAYQPKGQQKPRNRKSEGEPLSSCSDDATAAVMNSIVARGTLAGRTMSRRDERRIESLEQRCADMQRFLSESSARCRRLVTANGEAANLLHEKRQLVSLQLKELAALKLERDKAEQEVEQLQHAVQKRTRELDHAEQSNIRMVERRLVSLVEESKVKEDARRKKVVSPEQRRSRSPPPPSLVPLTTSNLLQMEVTNKRMAALRATSPTAAVGTKFRYDEFGTLTTTSDVDLLAKPMHQEQQHQSRSPKGQHGATSFVIRSADPTINVSDVNKTQHVPSPSKVFPPPPQFVAAAAKASVATSPLRFAESSSPVGQRRPSAIPGGDGSPVASLPQQAVINNLDDRRSLDIAFMNAALYQQQAPVAAAAAAAAAKSPDSREKPNSPNASANDVSVDSSSKDVLKTFKFPAADPQIFANLGERVPGRKASMSDRFTSNEPQNTSYATVTPTTASESEGTPKKRATNQPYSVSDSTLRSPPPVTATEPLLTPPAVRRQSQSAEKRASVIGLANVPAPASSSSSLAQPSITAQGSLVEVSPPSPSSPGRPPGSSIQTMPSSPGSSLLTSGLPVELSNIIERNNDAIRRLSIEHGLGSSPGKLRGPSFERRPSAAEILNMSSESLASIDSGRQAVANRRASLMCGGGVVTAAPTHVYNPQFSELLRADGNSRASLSLLPGAAADGSPISRRRHSVR